MIEAKGLSLKYSDGTQALRNIDLHIKRGDLVYLIGPSGSGKTSLLKLFMGAEYPTKGSLKVLGQPILQGQNGSIRSLRKVIGPVFQEFRLIKGRTAMENVILGMRFLNIPPSAQKANAINALTNVSLAHKAFSLIDNLSWGERQRVAIARAVARKPVIILADEPTGNLDKDNALNILDLLTSFRNKDTCVIITTHATHLIDGRKGARIIYMDNGISMENKKINSISIERTSI